MPAALPLTPDQFATKWTGKFAYNVWQLIDDASFREQTADLVATFGSALLPALQTFRFRTRAEADAAYGGQVLEEIDYATLFCYAHVLVEFYREDPTDPAEGPHQQELLAVYDPSPTAKKGYRTAGGKVVGDAMIGLRLVKLTDPAATGVLAYDAQDATITKADIPRYYDAADGQGVLFYASTGPLPVPVPAPQGNTGGGWALLDKPAVPGGGGASGITASQLEAVRTTLAASATQTGSYTLQLADAGQQVPINSSSAVVVSVPTDATAAFAVGTIVEVSQEGTGQVTIAGASGVTVTGYGGAYKTSGQYAAVGLRKTAANAWRVTGGVS